MEGEKKIKSAFYLDPCVLIVSHSNLIVGEVGFLLVPPFVWSSYWKAFYYFLPLERRNFHSSADIHVFQIGSE